MVDRVVTVGDDMKLPAEVQTVLDTIIAAAVSSYAANVRRVLAGTPEILMTGTRTFNSQGMILASTVTWPDGITGNYAAVADTTTPSVPRSWTVTYERPGAQQTYTQPVITRSATGVITTKPAITVSTPSA